MAENGKKGKKYQDPRITLACAQDAIQAFEARDKVLRVARSNEKDASKLDEIRKATARNSLNLVRANKRVENLLAGPKAVLDVEDYI